MNANDKTMDEVMRFLATKSLHQWRSAADGMDATTVCRYAGVLDAIAERAARIAAYLEERGGEGNGDGGHDSAVKAANKAARRVRKARGYNCTKEATDVYF